MRYIDFIVLPPIKNQRIFIGNILNLSDVADSDLKAKYLEAKKASISMRYYCIYTVKPFYSGYSATPRCIVKAQFFDVAVSIAKASGLIEQDARVDSDYGNGEAVLHNPAKLPVIELVWDDKECTKMEHDVDYGVKSFDDIDSLGREVDSLRLGGLAYLEELHQLLTKNKALGESKGWSVGNMHVLLEGVIEILRKQI